MEKAKLFIDEDVHDRLAAEKLAIEFFKNRIEHSGIIVSPQRSFTETLSRLVKVLNEIPVADFKNQLIYI